MRIGNAEKVIGIIYTIFIVVLLATFVYVKMSNMSPTSQETPIETNTIHLELNDTTELVTELKQDIRAINHECAKLEYEIQLMQYEIDQLKEELNEYRYHQEWYRDIDLDDEYQKYIYEMCSELELDYDIALAKMKLESQFNLNARGYNKDSDGNIKSIDYGIGQINSNNINWCSELAGREIDVINNVYDNIESSLRIYKHYKDYWVRKGYNGLELEIRALNSYNRGISGYLNYMKEGHSYDEWKYAKLVMRNLEDIRRTYGSQDRR